MYFSALMFVFNHFYHSDELISEQRVTNVYRCQVFEIALIAVYTQFMIIGSKMNSAESIENKFMSNPFFKFISDISFEHFIMHSFF